MPKLTRDMSGTLNQRLADRGSAYAIVDTGADYDGIDYTMSVRVEPASDTSFAPELIDHYQYTNCSEVEQEVTGETTKTVEDTVSYEFKESIGGSIEVEGEANIIFAKAKTTVKVEVSFDATQAHEHKESFELKTETPFKVEKHSVLTAQVLVFKEEANDVPFVAHLVIRGGQLPVMGTNSVPLYRYYNNNSGQHFYAIDWGELGGGGHDGWVYEGVECYVDPSQRSGEVPLHRYFSGQSGHFYTTNFAELGNGDGNYTYEGVECYVFNSQVPTTVPLYRYYNGSVGHFYTTDFGELGGGNSDWSYEGVQCYVYTPADAYMNITDLLPDESDRIFDVPGSFRGSSHVRKTEIRVDTRTVTPGECGSGDALKHQKLDVSAAALQTMNRGARRIPDAQRESGRLRFKATSFPKGGKKFKP